VCLCVLLFLCEVDTEEETLPHTPLLHTATPSSIACAVTTGAQEVRDREQVHTRPFQRKKKRPPYNNRQHAVLVHFVSAYPVIFLPLSLPPSHPTTSFFPAFLSSCSLFLLPLFIPTYKCTPSPSLPPSLPPPSLPPSYIDKEDSDSDEGGTEGEGRREEGEAGRLRWWCRRSRAMLSSPRSSPDSCRRLV